MDDVTVERIETPFDPVTAYARLRSYTPDRASFLLEARGDADGFGRYSIVGYRVRSGEGLPPGVDAVETQSQSFGAETAADGLAANLVDAAVGCFASSCVRFRRRVPLFEDEGMSGKFLRKATIMLYDHVEGSVTVAGPTKGNLVPRLIWELEHGPDIAPVKAASPSKATPLVDATKLAARAKRARGYLDDELTKVVLHASFAAPLGERDAFDVYRAWRERSERRFGYFVDFGTTPMNPSHQILGMADTPVSLRRDGSGPTLVEGYYAALPLQQLVGTPEVLAYKVVRKVQDESPQIFGGAVGYVCAGGDHGFVAADDVISIESSTMIATRAIPLTRDNDPAAAFDTAQAEALANLGAEL